MRVSKRIYFGERFNVDLIADMFNIANKMNVAAVSPLYSNAGLAHRGLRSAPVPVRDEAELVKQPTFASVVCRLRSTALRSRALSRQGFKVFNFCNPAALKP